MDPTREDLNRAVSQWRAVMLESRNPEVLFSVITVGMQGEIERRSIPDAPYTLFITKVGPRFTGPRFTGRIIFPRNSKLTVFDPDIPSTPIYRAKPFPSISIPVNRGPTVCTKIIT
eukprot:sb/3476625/